MLLLSHTDNSPHNWPSVKVDSGIAFTGEGSGRGSPDEKGCDGNLKSRVTVTWRLAERRQLSGVAPGSESLDGLASTLESRRTSHRSAAPGPSRHDYFRRVITIEAPALRGRCRALWLRGFLERLPSAIARKHGFDSPTGFGSGTCSRRCHFRAWRRAPNGT